jgi:hypothetical protein
MLDKQMVISEMREIYDLQFEPPKDMVSNFFNDKKIKFKFNEFFNALIYSKKYDVTESEVKNERE